jgi:hypothetical protein
MGACYLYVLLIFMGTSDLVKKYKIVFHKHLRFSLVFTIYFYTFRYTNNWQASFSLHVRRIIDQFCRIKVRIPVRMKIRF